MKNQRGAVYLETLIGFLPVFMFFFGTLQVADASVARLVVEHAATTAARAAVVVLPDDGAWYRDEDNAAVDEFRDYRQSDVERAADTILAATGRLDRRLTNVALDKPRYEQRELLTARVTAPYRCWITAFCPSGITMSSTAQLVYQGAKYKYEASTGWATSAANRGLDNVRGGRPPDPGPSDPNDPNGNGSNPNDDPTNPNDGNPNRPNDPTNPNDGDPNRPNDPTNPNDGNPNRPNDPTNPNDGNPNRPNDPTNPNDPGDGTRPSDGTQRPTDPELQRRGEELQRALPPNLRNTPVVVDPTLDGTTVRVHYTHNDRGVITGVEIRVGPDAQPRHIRDHVPTVRTMQRYQGVAGRARALAQRFTSWLTGNPNAGPGSLAWESRREVEKLSGIIESRQRELEDPNLTPERRAELERELASYERQLAHHEQVLRQVTNDPGRGYVAADSDPQAARALAIAKYTKANSVLPPGYGWRYENGQLTVVNLPGNNGPLRRFDPAAAARAERTGRADPNAIFPVVAGVARAQFRDGSESHRPMNPDVIARMDDAARERRDQIIHRDNAESEVTRLANQLGLDPDEILGDEGPAAIANARNNPALDRDVLGQLEHARKDLTDARNGLSRASEQLGNEMALDYMRTAHPNARRVFPPVDPNNPDAPIPPGVSGEFDFVYVEGDPPNQTIIVVEAKGADSKLGESRRAGGQQGTPQYLDYIARNMLGNASSPLSEPLEDILMRTQEGGARVQYLLVEAPVDVAGNAGNGRVREFDL